MKRIPKIKPATTASEVLANALRFWGRDGRRWMKGTLGSLTEGGVCFYGGLSVGAFGTELQGEKLLWWPADGVPSHYNQKSAAAYRKAEKYILDELEARGFGADIVGFNDRFNDSHLQGGAEDCMCSSEEGARG